MEKCRHWLRANQLWQLVSGQKKRPVVDENSKSRESQQDQQDAWDDKAEKAAGWIYLMVNPSQTVHLKGKEDGDVLGVSTVSVVIVSW